MISSIKAIFWTVLQYKDGIEIAVWGIGLLAILATAIQLREAQKERGLTESFEIYEKIEGQLAQWSSSIKNENKDIDDSLGKILGFIEITANAINKGHLSKIAHNLLTNQIIDTLLVVLSESHTRDRYAFICDKEYICCSMKVFLLKNYKKVLKRENPEYIYIPVFGQNGENLFSSRSRSIFFRWKKSFELQHID